MDHVFLVPPGPGDPDLSEALAQVRRTLGAWAPEVVAVASTAWRPFHFTVASRPGQWADVALVAQTAHAARARDLFVGTESRDVDPGAAAALAALFPVRFPEVVLLGVARQSPERAALMGEAVAAALRATGRRSALIGVGRLSTTGSDESGRCFDEGLLASLEARQADQLTSSDPEIWIEGRPDAELGHLFLLLGASGAFSRGETLGYSRRNGFGQAVVRFDGSPPKGDPVPPAERRIIALKDVGHD